MALDDVVSTGKNASVTFDPRGNDSDPDGDSLTIVNVAATNGVASILGGTSVLFTPANNFTGSATVGYTISDGNSGTATALITVNVSNRPPVAVNDSASTQENR